MCSNKDPAQPKTIIIMTRNIFNLILFTYSFPELDCLSVFFGVHWASWWVYFISFIICHLFHYFPVVNSYVSCAVRSPGHLPIPKHSLKLWRVQAWVEVGALETTQSHQPRNWVGPAHNQARALRFYISLAASPDVHNGIGQGVGCAGGGYKGSAV